MRWKVFKAFLPLKNPDLVVDMDLEVHGEQDTPCPDSWGGHRGDGFKSPQQTLWHSQSG